MTQKVLKKVSVFIVGGISPTIKVGGDPLKFIVAERGRKYRGQEPKLEPNLKGITNTITTVEKDNYVLESKVIRECRGDKDARQKGV